MLSVVITAWNEEKNIARAISSAKPIADEIVVIDTESTDKTAEIAKKLGAKVFHHKNTGIVEPVRNFSISKAKGDWILLLDADEEISQNLASHVRSAIAEPNVDYFRIPRRNIIFNKWIQSEHWWPDYVYRLFKKGAVTWDPAIHSIPFTRGTGRDFPADESHALVHHNYSSISQFIDRMNRYTDHQLEQIISQGHNFSWTDLVSKPIEEFLLQYFSRKGYKDGLHGLGLSLLQGFSMLVLYMKLWEKSGFVPESISPSQFNQQLTTHNQQLKWWKYQVRVDKANFITKSFLKLLRKLS
ncbi:MAG: Glycosyl transferase family protein [Microgenomates group bacterium Gr01-1014_16]|nr:MAG: Glycosyl transferase family protein [Microgenomates group bacterium Gr01-1014_16]